MERLTYMDKKGEAHLHCHQMCADAHEDCNTAYEVDRCQRYVAFRKLADYEDAEEHGLLLRLPCKVGTDVYYILGIPNETPCTIDSCVFELSDVHKIGKSLFLTRAEAEAKLKEMECNHE